MILHHRKSLDILHKLVGACKQCCETHRALRFPEVYEQAQQWLDLGFRLGVGGVVTYPRAQKNPDSVWREYPQRGLVLETDSPDMPLQGYQGQRNEPAAGCRGFFKVCVRLRR